MNKMLATLILFLLLAAPASAFFSRTLVLPPIINLTTYAQGNGTAGQVVVWVNSTNINATGLVAADVCTAANGYCNQSNNVTGSGNATMLAYWSDPSTLGWSQIEQIPDFLILHDNLLPSSTETLGVGAKPFIYGYLANVETGNIYSNGGVGIPSIGLGNSLDFRIMDSNSKLVKVYATDNIFYTDSLVSWINKTGAWYSVEDFCINDSVCLSNASTFTNDSDTLQDVTSRGNSTTDGLQIDTDGDETTEVHGDFRVDGHVAVGIAPSTIYDVYLKSLAYSDQSANLRLHHQSRNYDNTRNVFYYGYGNPTTTNLSNYANFYGYAFMQPSSGTTISGFYNQENLLRGNGLGYVTKAYNTYDNFFTDADKLNLSQAYNYFSTMRVASGTKVNNIYNFFVSAPNIQGETTSQYGVYVNDVAGATTNNYAWYSKLGDSRFGDAVSVDGSGATDVQLTVKGAVGQTANLQEWQNSAGTFLSGVGKDGNFQLANNKEIGASGYSNWYFKPFSTTPTHFSQYVQEFNTYGYNPGTRGWEFNDRTTNRFWIDSTNGDVGVTGNLNVTGYTNPGECAGGYSEGDLCYNSTSHHMAYYNGTSLVSI